MLALSLPLLLCFCVFTRAALTLHDLQVFNARYQTAPCSPLRTTNAPPTTSCSAAGSTFTASTATSSRETAAAVTLAAAIPAGVARLRIPEAQRGRQEPPHPREALGQRGAAQQDLQARLNPPAYPAGPRAVGELLRQQQPGQPLALQRQTSDCPGELCQGQAGLWGDQVKVERCPELLGLWGDQVKVERSPEQRRHIQQHWGDRKRPLQDQQALIEEQEPLVQLLRQNLATSDEDIPDLTPGKQKFRADFEYPNHHFFLHQKRSHIEVLVHSRGGDGTGDDPESFRAVATTHRYPRTSSHEDSRSSSIQRVSRFTKVTKKL